jgi:hypothetical protein
MMKLPSPGMQFLIFIFFFFLFHYFFSFSGLNLWGKNDLKRQLLSSSQLHSPLEEKLKKNQIFL